MIQVVPNQSIVIAVAQILAIPAKICAFIIQFEASDVPADLELALDYSVDGVTFVTEYMINQDQFDDVIAILYDSFPIAARFIRVTILSNPDDLEVTSTLLMKVI